MVDEAAQERVSRSDYMHWAKTRSHAPYNLASSGLMSYPLGELPVRLEDLELTGPSFYGYAPLVEALAAKCGVVPESVVTTTGTSMANHLVMAALLRPGDEVLIEHPTYELLSTVARYFGARVRRFARPFEEGFRLDAADVERRMTPGVRLIVLTNLHNPSGAFTDEETLRRIGATAREAGAHVLVDEVYLDAMFERTPRSAFHLGPEFIVTNSLTKVYGLSGLRCGWVLAAPEVAERVWRLNDLFGVIPAHAAERLSCIALANLERIGARARSLLDANRDALNAFLATRDDLQAPPHEFGTVSFPRLKRGSVEALATLLRERYETSIVPGKFFEMEQHFRIGTGNETATFTEGLARLGAALDEMRRSG